jgi:hypothetical protein
MIPMLPMLAQMLVYHPVRSNTDENVADALGISKPNLPGIEKSNSVIPRMSNAYLLRKILQTRKHGVFLLYDRCDVCPKPKIKCITQHRTGVGGVKDIITGQILHTALDNVPVGIFKQMAVLPSVFARHQIFLE